MAQVTPIQVIAAGRIVSAAGAWTVTGGWIRGASPTIVDGGVGIATITLDDPADATVPGTVTIVSPIDAATGTFGTSTRPSDTTVQFNLWSATGAAADISFNFVVLQGPTTTV